MKTRILVTLWALALLIGALTLGDGMGAVAGLVALGLVFVDGYQRFRGGLLEEEERPRG